MDFRLALAAIALAVACGGEHQPPATPAKCPPVTAIPQPRKLQTDKCPVGWCGSGGFGNPDRYDERDLQWLANTPRVSTIGDLMVVYCVCPPSLDHQSKAMVPDYMRTKPTRGAGYDDLVMLWCECPKGGK